MPTQIQIAKEGKISDELYAISRVEKVDLEFLRQNIANGKVVIFKNNSRALSKPVAVGSGLRTKIATYIGVTDKRSSIENETDKILVAKEAGVDVFLDITSIGYPNETRKILINSTNLPYGTIPVFEAAFAGQDKYDVSKITKDNLFSSIETQLNDGADFICLNCSLTKQLLDKFEIEKFFIPPITNSGILTASAIKSTGIENPLYENFDELIDLISKYDATLYLSQSLKPCSVENKHLRASLVEANISAELAMRARNKNVQTIIETGGYLQLDKISPIIKTVKDLASGTPLASECIIPTDIALGYEVIASSIGYTNAVLAGANLLFAVQNSIAKNNSSTLKEGIMSAKISAHCADVVLGVNSQIIRNKNVTDAIKNHDAILYRESLIDGYSPNPEIIEKINNGKNSDSQFTKIYNKYFNSVDQK